MTDECDNTGHRGTCPMCKLDPMTDKPTRLEVTQADREAAHRLMISQSRSVVIERKASEILRGERDADYRVQAFAAHRLAHTVPEDVGLRECAEAAYREWVDRDMPNLSGNCDCVDVAMIALQRAALSTSPAVDTDEGLGERVKEVIGRMADALDVADRLIERGYGIDAPAEWNAEMKAVAEARAALDKGEG